MKNLFSKNQKSLPRLRVFPLKLPLRFLEKWFSWHWLRKLVPITSLKRHGYIVGKSGSGKSELLKLLLIMLKTISRWFRFSPKIDRSRCVIFLDPHGDTALECAQQKIFLPDFLPSRKEGCSPDLVFISPALDAGFVPSLNPFDLHGKSYTADELDVLAQYLTRAFGSMLSTSDDSLSRQMTTFLTPLMTALLHLSRSRSEPATFFDLAYFLVDTRHPWLLDYARQQMDTPWLHHFFENIYQQKRFEPTRNALLIRLTSFLNSRRFVHLLAHPHSTWNLQALMAQGKTIIISAPVSVLGVEISEMYGRTLTSLIQGYAFLRASKSRRPTFLIIDEATRFLSDDVKTILSECRKFGLHLILANQMVGQGGMSRELNRSILGNTAIKIVGNAGADTRRIMARECDVPESFLTSLPVGTFLIKSGNALPARVSLPTCFSGTKEAVSAQEFTLMTNEMLKMYYRPISSSN